jgi:hypothetical protein
MNRIGTSFGVGAYLVSHDKRLYPAIHTIMDFSSRVGFNGSGRKVATLWLFMIAIALEKRTR